MTSAGEEPGPRAPRLEQRRRRLPVPVSPAGEALRTLKLESQFAPEVPAAPLDLTAYWRALVRRRWTVLACLLIALAVGAAVTLLTRPIYTAEATLQIDREAEKVVSRDEATPADNLGEEFYQTQYGLLRSHALAERVAQSLGLLGDDGFIAQMKGETLAAAAHTAIRGHGRTATTLALLRKNQAVEPERGSRLVTVAFSSPDPKLSARVANAFAENFIQSAMDRKYESSSYARDFLQNRLAQVKAKLEESERALVAYAAAQHIVEMPTESPAGGDSARPEAAQSLPAANLQAYNAAVAAARAERIRAEERLNQAQSASGTGLAEILQSPTIQQLSEEKDKLAAQYQDRLAIYKPDYPDMRQLSARISELNSQIAAESEAIKASLKGQYLAALAAEKALEGQVTSSQGQVLDLRARSIQYTILQREVDTNRSLYDGLLQRYKEVGVAGGVSANNISIVDRATPPLTPSRPKPLINMGIAGALGLGLGVFFALVQDAMDQAIRSPRDIESELELPLLGTAPTLKRGVTPEEALSDARSQLAESYQSLRSALQFSTANGLPRTLLVTSPSPGGGKSTTASALARSYARLGQRVLLIDADLRNPSLHRVMNAEAHGGLTNLLTGATDLRESIQSTRFPNVFLVTSGPLPPNPAELLASERLTALVTEGEALFDLVIFDGPPVMGLADAPILGGAVEGVLLVVEANRNTRPQVRAAMRRLELAGAHLLGVMLTCYKAERGDEEYGYGYGYDYNPPLLPGEKSPTRLRGLRALMGRSARS